VSEGGGMKTPPHTNTGPKGREWRGGRWSAKDLGVRYAGQVCAATGARATICLWACALGPVSTATGARITPGGLGIIP